MLRSKWVVRCLNGRSHILFAMPLAFGVTVPRELPGLPSVLLLSVVLIRPSEMKRYLPLLPLMWLLSGCYYHETPFGRTAVIDLPVHNQTTVNKTVTINAPPGTTVIYQDAEPVGGYWRPRPYYHYHGD